MYTSSFLLVALIVPHVSEAFATLPSAGYNSRFGLKSSQQSSSSTTTSHSAVADIASKYFQLEENEDGYSAITEVFLSDEDNALLVGQTDGPIPTESQGTWMVREDGKFAMNLVRTFKTGRKGTDVGEFSFSVDRSFVGEVSTVGGCLAIGGVAHSVDDLGDREVGYFAMIDTANMREDGQDRKLGQRSSSS